MKQQSRILISNQGLSGCCSVIKALEDMILSYQYFSQVTKGVSKFEQKKEEEILLSYMGVRDLLSNFRPFEEIIDTNKAFTNHKVIPSGILSNLFYVKALTNFIPFCGNQIFQCRKQYYWTQQAIVVPVHRTQPTSNLRFVNCTE